MKYTIYRLLGTQYPITIKPAGVYAYLWKPSFSSVHPPDLDGIFRYWGIAYLLKLFGNHDYRVLYLLSGSRVVHRSVVMPRYFRWPFMNRDDLQVSSTWTDPLYRGRGYATYALIMITQLFSKPGRSIWYVTRDNNIPSVKVCLSAGFQLYNYAERKNFLGIPLLGKLVEEKVEPVSAFRRFNHFLVKNS
jgi:GNAT superfamily N-acetyltransferase